jgi:hypothetical protein
MPALADLSTNLSALLMPRSASETAAPPAAKRGTYLEAKWNTFNPNMLTTDGENGAVTLHREKYAEHDVALGQAIDSGIHEWDLSAPNWTANNFVGVALPSCDKRIYPAATSAWAIHLNSGDLCSGVAAKGLLNSRGRRIGAENPGWTKMPAKAGSVVTVILDMEAHTLSFAIGEGEPQLAFTNLPPSVNPYICSGDGKDRSVIHSY